MSFLKARGLVISLFAMVGAVLSLVALPNILDYIYERVKDSSVSGAGSTPKSVTIEQFQFRKITFVEKSRAQETLTGLLNKSLSFEAECTAARDACTSSQLSHAALSRTELAPLAKLKAQGGVALIKEDPMRDVWAVYQYQGKGGPSKQATQEESPQGYPGSRQPFLLLALALLGAILGGGIGNLVFNGSDRVRDLWREMETGDRVNLFVGTVVGVIGSLPFLIAFGSLGPLFATLLTLGLTLGFSALSVYALNSMEEVLPWKKGEVRGRRSGIKILDTNVLIDGRIYDVVRTGFLEGDIYVPKFVLKELQYIADSSDALRRQRGRRGLDVLRHLQNEMQIQVGDQDRLAGDASEDVDARLVKLALALGADLVSNDFNLNKVASIQEVRVLNINDLALSLRPTILPGETLNVQVIKEGSQAGQGVGYMDDGTMIVVEGGRARLGDYVEVLVTQVIQTERGKMIFGTLDGTMT